MMSARDQVIGAVLVAGVTWLGLHRIAEAKSEAAAGGDAFRLEERRGPAMAAFARLAGDLRRLGDPATAARLEQLRAEGAIWIAPRLDPGRWAVYVDSLGLVRRIYVRGAALLDPVGHLFDGVASEAPPGHREIFARVSLGGALVHELAHYDGLQDEGAAYDRELAWYARVRRSTFLTGLSEEARAAHEWALDSAVLSAEAARRRAEGAAPRS
jgi:hypothetical protein